MENKFYEEFKVKGQDLVDKVKSILHEGNVRRIILKDEKGQTFLEIPLSIAAVGVLAAPLLAGIGAIAALVANFTLVVERSSEDELPVFLQALPAPLQTQGGLAFLAGVATLLMMAVIYFGLRLARVL